METVKVYARPESEDGYGDTVYGKVPADAEPAMTLLANVAPNHDPTRVAVGRAESPVKFDVYCRTDAPLCLMPEIHIVEVRGDRYELDAKPAEWAQMAGPHSGDHFTVTTPIN
jgi:hypothetical protein